MIRIEAIKKEQLNDFINYLSIHLSENGKGKTYFFLPMTHKQSELSKAWKDKFESGMYKKFGETGWRKLWIATNQDNQIVGHIDIRHYKELNTSHRVLLGMGVDSNFRKLKIGQKMLEFVIEYCQHHEEIDWLDLQVMTLNTPAVNLYEKLKFKVVSNVVDMFRINGVSYDYTSMTLNVRNN